VISKPLRKHEEQQHGIVVPFPITRTVVVREPDEGGWMVLTPTGQAWLHGSRREALADKRELDRFAWLWGATPC
jgi:hypothetical protein